MPLLGRAACVDCVALSYCPLGSSDSEADQSLPDPHYVWRVPKRRIIYAEGTPADALYLLRCGSVKLLTNVAGDQRIVAIISAGDFFGVDSLLLESRRSFTAVAREPSILCRFDEDRTAAEWGSIEFLSRITRVLARTVNHHQSSHLHLSGCRIRKRLLQTISEYKEKSISLKHAELAQLIGCSPETISRLLRLPKTLRAEKGSEIL